MSSTPNTFGRYTVPFWSLMALLAFIAIAVFLNPAGSPPEAGAAPVLASPGPPATSVEGVEPQAKVAISIGEGLSINSGQAQIDLSSRSLKTTGPSTFKVKSNKPLRFELNGPREATLRSGAHVLYINLLDTGSIVLVSTADRSMTLGLSEAANVRLKTWHPSRRRKKSAEQDSVPSFN